MGFGERLLCRRIVAQMGVNRVAPIVRRGDLDVGPVDGAHAPSVRRDTDDRAFGCRLGQISPTDVRIMDTPIDPIDEQIMAIAMLVGEPAHDDATDEPRSLPGRGIENQAIGGRALDLSCRSEEHTSEPQSPMRSSYAV